MKKITMLLLTLVIILNVGTTVFAEDTATKQYPQKFYDVPKDHWAFGYIAELADRGVIAGYEDGSFKPNSTVTRAEWAKIMVGAAGIPTNDRNVYFSDMQNHWAITYVNAAKDYLTAYADNTYRPSQAAVREDVTVAMVKLKGYDLSNVDYSYLNFTDTDSISNNIKQYVAVAVEKGLISGFENKTFRGQATLTRAEAATLLWRAFQYGSDNKVVDTQTTAVTPSPTVTAPTATQNTQKEPTQTTPTVIPIATPEPTEKPVVTVAPTEKPFKIDTVVKADVKNNYDYTYGSGDNIYYVEDNKVYSVSIVSGDKAELLDLADLVIDNDEMTLADFGVESICYDDYTNCLLILGKYNAVNSINVPNNHYLYSVNQKANSENIGSVELITDNFYSGNTCMTCVLSNGDYVMAMEQISPYKSVSGGIIDKDSFNKKSYFNAVSDIAEVDGKLYYVSSSRPNEYVPYTHSFTEYDFTAENVKWQLGSNINAISVDSKWVVFINNNVIYIYNYNGKLLDMIATSDCRIVDMTSTSFSENSALVSFYASGRLLLTDYGFVFYDTNAKAFRIISENN